MGAGLHGVGVTALVGVACPTPEGPLPRRASLRTGGTSGTSSTTPSPTSSTRTRT